MVVKKDFKKQKAKVGRKVQQDAATKINIKSKKILLPTQNMGSETPNIFRLQHVISQLRHSNGPNRLDGLRECETHLNKNAKEIAKHLQVVVPYVFEMLFHEELKVRAAASSFILKVIQDAKMGESLVGILQLIVSFLCSCMSSLMKGVRKDGLVVLKEVALRYDLSAHSSRIFDCLLLITQDPSLLMNWSAAVNQTQPNSPESALGILSMLPSSKTKAAMVSKRKSEELSAKQKSFTNKDVVESTAVQKSTLFCLLDALYALLGRNAGKSQGKSFGISPAYELAHLHHYVTTINFAQSHRSSNDSSAVLSLQFLLYHWGHYPSSDTPATVEGNNLLMATKSRIGLTLLHHFHALASTEDKSHELILLLRQISQVLLCLFTEDKGVVEAIKKEMKASIEDMLCLQFPFYCSDISKYALSHPMHRSCVMNAEELNLILCEIVLHNSNDSAVYLDSVVNYLTDILQKCTEEEYYSQNDHHGHVGNMYKPILSGLFSLSCSLVQSPVPLLSHGNFSAVFISALNSLLLTDTKKKVSDIDKENSSSHLACLLVDSVCSLTSSLFLQQSNIRDYGASSSDTMTSLLMLWQRFVLYITRNEYHSAKLLLNRGNKDGDNEYFHKIIRCVRDLSLLSTSFQSNESKYYSLINAMLQHFYSLPFLCCLIEANSEDTAVKLIELLNYFPSQLLLLPPSNCPTSFNSSSRSLSSSFLPTLHSNLLTLGQKEVENEYSSNYIILECYYSTALSLFSGHMDVHNNKNSSYSDAAILLSMLESDLSSMSKAPIDEFLKRIDLINGVATEGVDRHIITLEEYILQLLDPFLGTLRTSNNTSNIVLTSFYYLLMALVQNYPHALTTTYRDFWKKGLEFIVSNTVQSCFNKLLSIYNSSATDVQTSTNKSKYEMNKVADQVLALIQDFISGLYDQAVTLSNISNLAVPSSEGDYFVLVEDTLQHLLHHIYTHYVSKISSNNNNNMTRASSSSAASALADSMVHNVLAESFVKHRVFCSKSKLNSMHYNEIVSRLANIVNRALDEANAGESARELEEMWSLALRELVADIKNV